MDNLIVFHGTDHKVGTTMISQSVAELIAAGKKEESVLLLSLNGRRSTDYVRDPVWPIDYFKARIDSGLPIEKGLISAPGSIANLYRIAGIENELEERFYSPKTAEKMLEGLSGQFDLILADTGNEPDNGLALGGLLKAGKRFLVLTQQETAIRRLEKNRDLYERLGAEFDGYIVNQFLEKDPHSMGYLSERLSVQREALHKVDMASFGRRAEMEYRTMLQYGEGKYVEDIRHISNLILREAGIEEIKLQRKNKWKNFIWTNI